MDALNFRPDLLLLDGKVLELQGRRCSYLFSCG